MDWKIQMQEDIATIAKFSNPNSTPTAHNSDATATNKIAPQQPPIIQESRAHQILREIMPLFRLLNDMFCKAYQEHDEVVAGELRRRVHWAMRTALTATRAVTPSQNGWSG